MDILITVQPKDGRKLQLPAFTVSIPDNIQFADLQLQHDGEALRFNVALLQRVWDAAGLNVDATECSTANLSFLVVWYFMALDEHQVINAGAHEFIDAILGFPTSNRDAAAERVRNQCAAQVYEAVAPEREKAFAAVAH